MTDFAQYLAVGFAGIGLGYFIPRSRDVMTRIDALPSEEEEAQGEEQTTCYEECFEALPVPALLVDKQGLILHANGAAAELFGRSAEQMRGRALVEATGSVELDQLASEARI